VTDAEKKAMEIMVDDADMHRWTTFAVAIIEAVGRDESVIIGDKDQALAAFAGMWLESKTALLASAAREQRMAKVVEWAKRWRTETCSRVLGCDTYDGTHGGECEITRNEREGCTLVDALDAPPGRGE